MNREQWLQALAIKARPYIAQRVELGGDEESAVRLSCGFPPASGRKKAKAALIPPSASDDFTAEIFVSPEVSDASEVARLVLPLLVAVQAQDWKGTKASRIANGLGITMTQDGQERLGAAWEEVVDFLGSYPHASLNIPAKAKQTTRLIKVACPTDGYIARVSRSTLDNLGSPICPACNQSLREDV